MQQGQSSLIGFPCVQVDTNSNIQFTNSPLLRGWPVALNATLIYKKLAGLIIKWKKRTVLKCWRRVGLKGCADFDFWLWLCLWLWPGPGGELLGVRQPSPAYFQGHPWAACGLASGGAPRGFWGGGSASTRVSVPVREIQGGLPSGKISFVSFW